MYKRVGNHAYIYQQFLKYLSSVAQSLTKIGPPLIAKRKGQEIATELNQITLTPFSPTVRKPPTKKHLPTTSIFCRKFSSQ